MTDSPQQRRSWSLEEYLTWLEQCGSLVIVPPFTSDERTLAAHIGAAWHFWAYQAELLLWELAGPNP